MKMRPSAGLPGWALASGALAEEPALATVTAVGPLRAGVQP